MIGAWASAVAAVMTHRDVKTVGVVVVVLGESLSRVGVGIPSIVILIHFVMAVVIVVSSIVER